MQKRTIILCLVALFGSAYSQIDSNSISNKRQNIFIGLAPFELDSGSGEINSFGYMTAKSKLFKYSLDISKTFKSGGPVFIYYYRKKLITIRSHIGDSIAPDTLISDSLNTIRELIRMFKEYKTKTEQYEEIFYSGKINIIDDKTLKSKKAIAILKKLGWTGKFK